MVPMPMLNNKMMTATLTVAGRESCFAVIVINVLQLNIVLILAYVG